MPIKRVLPVKQQQRTRGAKVPRAASLGASTGRGQII